MSAMMLELMVVKWRNNNTESHIINNSQVMDLGALRGPDSDVILIGVDGLLFAFARSCRCCSLFGFE